MKKIIYLAIAVGLMACAPGKSDKISRVDVYCNDCDFVVKNKWYTYDNKVIETPFEGRVIGYRRIEFNRFDSPNSCVTAYSTKNYSTDTVKFYYIEGLDTIGREINDGTGYCH